MLENTEFAAIKLLEFVKSLHAIPRFGHSKDIALFFADDNELRRDYMLGLVTVFSIIMGIAVIWFLSLLILRILGHRVGCAAGRAPTIPAEPMMDNGKASVNTDETGEFIVMQADQNRVNRTRIMFFISVLYALASCAVLIWSIFAAQGSLQNMYENLEDVTDGFIQMPKSLDTSIEASTEFLAPRDDLVNDLANFCPDSSATVGGVDPANLTATVKTSLDAIPNMEGDTSWNTYNASLTEMNEILSDALSFLGFLKGPSEVWFISLISACGCTIFITLYLLACAWKSGKEGYEFSGEDENSCGSKFLHFVALPFFAVLVAGAWFITSIALTSGASNADFCYDEITTGDTVLRFLRNLDFSNTSEFYALTDDYLHVCVDEVSSTMSSADDFNTFVSDAKANMAIFSALDVDELEAACAGDATTTSEKVQSLSLELDSLASDFSRVYDHMSCSSIAPIVQKNSL